jgi:uncharacterized protein
VKNSVSYTRGGFCSATAPGKRVQPSTVRTSPHKVSSMSTGLGIVEHVLAGAWRRDSPLHGEAHWLAVATTGLDLAAETGADPRTVFLFGLLHDTRRLNDTRDPDHGPRAAAFARELHGDGVLLLDEERLELLCLALELHANGQVSAEPTVGTCWDADRLHLTRLGFTLNPVLLSTEAARTKDAQAAAIARREIPLSWERLLGAAGDG